MSFTSGAAGSVAPAGAASTAGGSVPTGAVPGTAASFLGGGVGGTTAAQPTPPVTTKDPNALTLEDVMGALGKSSEEIAANLKGLGGAAQGASAIVKGIGETSIPQNIETIRNQRIVEQLFAQLQAPASTPNIPTNPAAARELLSQFGLPGA